MYDTSLTTINPTSIHAKNYALEIEVGANRLAQVNSLVYLGYRVTKDVNCANEVKSRLTIGMAIMVKLAKVWKHKSISNSTKLRLNGALVWSVATWGCEAWTLKIQEETRIQAF